MTVPAGELFGSRVQARRKIVLRSWYQVQRRQTALGLAEDHSSDVHVSLLRSTTSSNLALVQDRAITFISDPIDIKPIRITCL